MTNNSAVFAKLFNRLWLVVSADQSELISKVCLLSRSSERYEKISSSDWSIFGPRNWSTVNACPLICSKKPSLTRPIVNTLPSHGETKFVFAKGRQAWYSFEIARNSRTEQIVRISKLFLDLFDAWKILPNFHTNINFVQVLPRFWHHKLHYKSDKRMVWNQSRFATNE